MAQSFRKVREDYKYKTQHSHVGFFFALLALF